MKKILLFLCALIFIQTKCFLQTRASFTEKNIPSTQEDWSQRAQQYLQASSCFFKNVSGKYAAVNSKQRLLCEVTENSISVKPAEQKAGFTGVSMRLINIGSEEKKVYDHPVIYQKDNLLEYAYAGYTTQYISNEKGIRQNFIIHQKEPSGKKLEVNLAITGDLTPLIDRNALFFKNKLTGATCFSYDGLSVWDADNKKLAAHMELHQHELKIIVDDAAAKYPVTIDPLTHAPEWEGSPAGLLPGLLTNLQLQIDALYGYKVWGIGDINGDGFDDAAISAPGAIDIIAGPSTLVNVGAVFIYYGSGAGLSVVPDRVLRPTTPIANALFGFSISAGNVTGNSNRDVIIGAPGDKYTAMVAGTPTSASVTAGKVYVFDGSDIANNITGSPASLFLDGAVYLSNGILGVGANVNTNALFGFSVSATDDMNGDGKGEVLVGAPGYADAAVVLVRTGAAFIFSSDKITLNQAVRMNAPSLLNFPAGIVNLDGLLFGYSVDNAGDYNQDGQSDMIVGAPGGVNLGAPGFLGGSAYVFYGNGSIINNSFGTQLSAGGGLLSTAANLFGFEVRGLKSTSGINNGNIIVSSPVSNVLSNIVGGLRLKSGALNVFTAKASPGTTETPVQKLFSPRGTSLVSILGGQNIDANVLTGTSVDNMLDANCDGYGDIIVGEPLSTAVGLIGANAVGGAAYIFTGKPDGTFNTVPYWTLENNVSFDFGVNAGSLLGYSVSGLGHVAGSGYPVRVAVGAPGGALDYSAGIFNLGNTINVTSGFVAGNNGLGKAYVYSFQNCSILAVTLSSFTANAKDCDAVLDFQTGPSENLSHIMIEESKDGIQFSPAQTVLKKSDGVYNAELNQQSNTAFYRLRLVQTDGSSVISDIKSVLISCGAKDRLAAYPSLFTGRVKIIYDAAAFKGKSVITIRDIYGRMIKNTEINITAGLNQTSFDGSSLARGIYFVQLSGQNYRSETVRILKD